MGQLWQHVETEESWRVKQLHRGDGGRVGPVARHLAPVVLERPGEGQRFLTFGELGGQYRLIEEPSGE